MEKIKLYISRSCILKLITNMERTKASDARQSQNTLHKNYVSKLDKKEKIMKKGKMPLVLLIYLTLSYTSP
jgi:hypothetical protein